MISSSRVILFGHHGHGIRSGLYMAAAAARPPEELR